LLIQKKKVELATEKINERRADESAREWKAFEGEKKEKGRDELGMRGA
jgi:hypothetical protein